MPFKVIVFLCSLFLAFAGKGFAQSSNFQPFLGDTLTRWEGLLSYFEPYYPYTPPFTITKGWKIFGHFEVEARPWGVVDSVMLHAVRFRYPGDSDWRSNGLFLYQDSNHLLFIATHILRTNYGGIRRIYLDNAFMDSTAINDAINTELPGDWSFDDYSPKSVLTNLGAKPDGDDYPEPQIPFFCNVRVIGNNKTDSGDALLGLQIDSVASINNQRVAYTPLRKGDFGGYSDSLFYPMLLNPGPNPNELFHFIEGPGNNFVLNGFITADEENTHEGFSLPEISGYKTHLHLSSLSCYWRDGNLISTHGLYPVYGCGSPLDSAWQFTGMQAQEATGALLYPNPSQGMVRIEAKELHQEASFYFVSMSGKVVYAIQGIDPQHLNTQSLSKGLYEVFFKNPDGQAYRVGRLVVP